MIVTNRTLRHWKRALMKGHPEELVADLRRMPSDAPHIVKLAFTLETESGHAALTHHIVLDFLTQRTQRGSYIKSEGRLLKYRGLGMRAYVNVMALAKNDLGFKGMSFRAGDTTGGNLWAQTGSVVDYPDAPMTAEELERRQRDLTILRERLTNAYQKMDRLTDAQVPAGVSEALEVLDEARQTGVVPQAHERLLWAVADDRAPLPPLPGAAQKPRYRGPEALMGCHYDGRVDFPNADSLERTRKVAERVLGYRPAL